MRFNSQRSRKGLTLIELVVVLLVLAALAGVAIPLAQNYLTRTHASSGAANLREITASITRYEVENFSMPDKWDSVIDGTGELFSEDAAGELTATPISQEIVDSLAAAGIATVVTMDEDAENKTFEASSGNEESLTAGSILVEADGTAIERELGSDPTETYIALGIGSDLTAIGRTMVGAPVHFPEGGEAPTEVYSRFLAIYQVTGVGEEKARFIGVVSIDHGGLAGVGPHLTEYYEAAG